MSDSDSEAGEASTHSSSLKKLKSKDPDFYEFLKENDKELLNFEDSDEEDDDQNQEEEEEASDEESSEEVFSLSASKLAYIKEHIRDAPTIKLCKEVMSAFKTAVHQAEGTGKKSSMPNSELFNDVIKLCLLELVPALIKALKLSPEQGKRKQDPSKSKSWKKVQTSVKSYLIDMLKMFSAMSDKSLLTLLLKHTVHLVPFYSMFIKLARNLVKKMISFWSTEEETVRVLALFIIIRSTKNMPKQYLGLILKEMYFAYIKNTKFTSPTTWPMINFMKRSLAEIYTLHPENAYEHGFVYIRQMSIHLRNALTTKKKESFQTVYNWQYTHCISLWSHLLCRLYEHEPIKSLVYPLVQTTIGTINLIPTAKYIPLRFHLIRALMHISESTGVFIPVLTLILDVLKMLDYNKKSSFSVKPVDFSCAIKVTKSQLVEAGFKDMCISGVCSLVAEYLKIYSNSIGFPELVLPVVLQFKNFMKQCKVSKYNQQLKNVLVKVEENSIFISEKRRQVNFGISDGEKVKRWEENIRSENPPLLKLKLESVTLKRKEEFEDAHVAPPQKRRKFRPKNKK